MLDELTYMKILNRFTNNLPFKQNINHDFNELINKKELKIWPGNWIFQTWDMNKKPIFLSDVSITEIMDRYTVLFRSDMKSMVDPNSPDKIIDRQKEKWWKVLQMNGKVNISEEYYQDE